ncbi:hypothetical protein K439DRAFT_1611529 [Ramaria rubella]|nr:hypothetical protein K439DRAFT_1611529 [Ramaria rubella]
MADIEHYHQPKQYFSPKAAIFFKECLKLDPECVALQFEAWCVAGPDKEKTSPKHTAVQEISLCRTMIQEGLVNILTKHRIAEKVTMNYENYEMKIPEERGVVLKGWLGEKVVNPGKLGACQRIWELLEALKNKECRWVTLTDRELEDHIAANKA